MKKNMGNLDRGIRIVAALVVAALIVTGTISGVLGVIAAVFVLTSVIGFCPLYAPLGINTCPRER